MYFFPGYIRIQMNNEQIIISSELYRNQVLIKDADYVEELKQIIKNGGTENIDSKLCKFLNEQKLLVTKEEIDDSLGKLNEIIEKTLTITIMPTENCNFRCAYCYEKHEAKTMNSETYNEIKRYLSVNISKYRFLNIGWFGGEPTLCKEKILDMSRFIRNLCDKESVKYSGTMTTNGYLLDVESFKEYFDEGISTFQITIDGWMHDKKRKLISGEGSLNKIIRNLVNISLLPKKKYKYRILLRHNVLANEIDYDWYTYINKLFGKDKRFIVMLRPVYDWGGESVKKLNLLSDNGIDNEIMLLTDYIKKLDLEFEDDARKGMLSDICYANYPHSMVVRSNGSIEKCTVCLDNSKNRIGVVKPGEGVIVNKIANDLWSMSTLDSKCYTCVNILKCMNRDCRMPALINAIDYECKKWAKAQVEVTGFSKRCI